MKLTEEDKYSLDEAFSRWAREFPEEAAVYEESISPQGVLLMEILDYWDEIEVFAKQYPGLDIVQVIRKWMALHPEKGL